MHKSTVMFPRDFKSTFLSVEKDIDTILRKLFVESQPYSDELKRVLVLNTKDCLDNKTSEVYKKRIEEMTLPKLREEGYIRLEPRISMGEFEEVMAYIIISVDSFATNATNPQFRDCVVNFDIVCHTKYWDIGNYRLRPIKIAGYIDGILNNSKLSGIGTFQFISCSQLLLDEELSGYSLSYYAIHGGEDRINPPDEA